MRPKVLNSKAWVDAFNRGDADAMAAFDAADAVNHQVAVEPVAGRDAIRAMFARQSACEMVCIVENIFEDGDWAILEWRDPLGLRGCGFFHVTDGKIAFQRGYWDRLTFLKAHNLPLENPSPLMGRSISPSPLRGRGFWSDCSAGNLREAQNPAPRQLDAGEERAPWRARFNRQRRIRA